jgi:hypothetical protein
VSADPATLDDLATAVVTVRVMAVRLEALATILVDDDPVARAGWSDVLDDMRKRLVRDGNALFYAHQRETGQPPTMYLSTQPARRCRFEVMDTDRSNEPVECGKPSGWRWLDPETVAARYGCPDHEGDLHGEAEAAGAQVERLPS